MLVDFQEEYSLSLRNYVSHKLFGLPGVSAAKVAGLVKLYGDVVFPEECVSILSRQEQDKAMAFRVLSTVLLKQEEKPTPTRFFLFCRCVWRLLLMFFLQLPQAAFHSVWATSKAIQGHPEIQFSCEASLGQMGISYGIAEQMSVVIEFLDGCCGCQFSTLDANGSDASKRAARFWGWFKSPSAGQQLQGFDGIAFWLLRPRSVELRPCGDVDACKWREIGQTSYPEQGEAILGRRRK